MSDEHLRVPRSTLIDDPRFRRGIDVYMESPVVRAAIDKLSKYHPQRRLVKDLLLFVAGNIYDRAPTVKLTKASDLERMLEDNERWLGYFGLTQTAFGTEWRDGVG